MMMEKSKPADVAAKEESLEQVNDRQAEIERRLAALGDISSDVPTQLNEDTQSNESVIDRNPDGIQVSNSIEQIQDLMAEHTVNATEDTSVQDSSHDASVSAVLESSKDVPSCETTTQAQEPLTATSRETIKPPTNSKSALLVSTIVTATFCHAKYCNVL
jgi:cysteinyl-tRNA synthetase